MKIPVYRFLIGSGGIKCDYFVCRLGEEWVAVAYSERPLYASHWGFHDPIRILNDESMFLRRCDAEHAVAWATPPLGYRREMLTATLDLDTGELTPWEVHENPCKVN